jgi:hypothetical protein
MSVERGMVVDPNEPPIVPTDTVPTDIPQPPSRHTPCPLCIGKGIRYGLDHYGTVTGSCDYCGGTGEALRKAVERDGFA